MIRKTVISVLVIAIVVFGIVLVAFDTLVKTAIERGGSVALGTPVTVSSVSISPLGGNGGIQQLRVANPEGFDAPYVMELGALNVDLQVGSVFSDVIEIDSIDILAPSITYETRITTDNIRTLMGNLPSGSGAADTPQESGGTSKKVIIRQFRMLQPQVNLVAVIGSAPVQLPDIVLQNIGEEDAAVTIAEAARQILVAVNQALANSDITSSEVLRQRVEEEIDEQVDRLQDQVESLGDRVRDIF